MANQYSSGKVGFKLYGVTNGAMQKARQEISRITNDAVQLNYSLYGADCYVELIKGDASDLLFDEGVKSFITTFSKCIYANENISLQESAVALLKISAKQLCTAESFTGGAIANAIVSVSGASEVFYEGMVCYNTNSKIQRLGVNPITVKNHTVVSREVAFEMVYGLLQSGNCDVAVATTGYASPTGDERKPCGLCYIAVGDENKIEVFKFNFKGNRSQIIEQGKQNALLALNKILRG